MNITDLTPGLYVCVRGGGYAGEIIREVTHAPVAHTYVYVGPQPDGTDMVEAQPHGVRKGHSSAYDWATSYPSLDVITERESSVMVTAALGSVGMAYGYIADFFIGLRDALHLPVQQELFELSAVTTHRECAQLADMVALKAGKHYFADNRLPGSVSPGDLWRRQYS